MLKRLINAVQWNTSNKILPIVGIITVLGIFFVLVRSCGEDQTAVPTMSTVPESPAPDADSPADTIKTLTANVGELIAEVDALKSDNEQLRDEREDMLQVFSNRVASQIADYHQHDRLKNERSQSEVAELHDRMDDLSRKIDNLAYTGPSSDLPIGIGTPSPSAPYSDTYTASIAWIDPLDTLAGGPDSLYADGVTNVRPVITVPANATLIGSTALTALIGRVPLEGHVRDPMPFKVMTGVENLAANGLKIDNIQGMVWSGYAVGDWTLSCVSGHLDSVTFLFEDGTIVHSATEGSGRTATRDTLGWISDEHGVPCLPGTRKSNAPVFLTQQIALDAARAASDAAAAAETTQTLDALGTLRSNVTGEITKYMLGKSLAGGAQASAQWLAERANQEFDAIYVAAGKSVAIHVEREIRIDYDTGGRKLHHDENASFPMFADFD